MVPEIVAVLNFMEQSRQQFLNSHSGILMQKMLPVLYAIYASIRGSQLMIPAKTTCPTGWTEEYDVVIHTSVQVWMTEVWMTIVGGIYGCG